MELEAELSRIVIDEQSDQQIIVIKEKDGERSFPIVIGIFEAIAISRHVRGDTAERPMTHDLLSSVVGGLDAQLEKIVVTELRGDTFHANLFLRTDGRVVEVDSRPSDAIALAVRQDARIYVAEQVFSRVNNVEGYSPDGEDGGGDSPEFGP